MERWTSRDESGYCHLRRIHGGKYEPTKKDLIRRVGQYEDTGLEPEEVRGLCEMDSRARVANLLRLEEYRELGPIDRLRELVQAEKDGRLVVLPCKDTTVYTIEEDFCNCGACEHKDRASYRPSINGMSCDMEGVHCPLYIAEHTVEGFEVSFKDGSAVLSSPGERTCEGLEIFSGSDRKWYLTYEEAEAALEAQKGGGER